MLKLVRQWLEAGVMEDGVVRNTTSGTPQGGVISPLLSNIYLHVLDVLWTRHSAPLGTLVRYADDFVVMCRTRKECEQAEQRIRVILERLGLELHPEKTRRVELYDGKEGFDFLGCHLHKRLSGKLLEEKGERLYFLQRWPSQRSMQRIRQRVKEMTPKSRCHADIRDIIADLNPVLRGWGEYFRTGNATKRFNQLDTYVWRRLRTLRVQRKGRHLRPGEMERWSRDYFHNLGLHRLRGNRPLPGNPCLGVERIMLHHERPPVSRVREIRMHGLKGGLALFALAYCEERIEGSTNAGARRPNRAQARARRAGLGGLRAGARDAGSSVAGHGSGSPRGRQGRNRRPRRSAGASTVAVRRSSRPVAQPVARAG